MKITVHLRLDVTARSPFDGHLRTASWWHKMAPGAVDDPLLSFLVLKQGQKLSRALRAAPGGEHIRVITAWVVYTTDRGVSDQTQLKALTYKHAFDHVRAQIFVRA